jgi:hypothetical protein
VVEVHLPVVLHSRIIEVGDFDDMLGIGQAIYFEKAHRHGIAVALRVVNVDALSACTVKCYLIDATVTPTKGWG